MITFDEWLQRNNQFNQDDNRAMIAYALETLEEARRIIIDVENRVKVLEDERLDMMKAFRKAFGA